MRERTIEETLEMIRKNPAIQAFLKEHARRESLPRKACKNCQFEYNEEDKHVCK